MAKFWWCAGNAGGGRLKISFCGESEADALVRGDCIGDEVMDDELDESAGKWAGILGEGVMWCTGRMCGLSEGGRWDVRRMGAGAA